MNEPAGEAETLTFGCRLNLAESETMRALAASLIRDAALPILWVAALAGHGFVWRGTEMAVAAPRRGLRAVPRRVLARFRGLTARGR